MWLRVNNFLKKFSNALKIQTLISLTTITKMHTVLEWGNLVEGDGGEELW